MACAGSPISSVPDDVLENVLMVELDAQDLCWLSGVSKRFASLTRSERLWASLFRAKYGEPTRLQARAAKLAGGWRQFYSSKQETDKKSHPWQRPSPFELKASLEKLTAPGHGGQVEVCCVFLLDGSGSVNEDEFSTQVEFVQSASATLKESVASAKVAVVQFSNDTRVEYDLAAVDEEQLHKATKDMVRMNGGTNVAVAVQKAGQLLKRVAGMDAVRHIVLLTDGRVDSYQAHEARQMADRLADEQRNVSFFAYGVGRGVDKPELLHIIGGPPTRDNTSGGRFGPPCSTQPIAAGGSVALSVSGEDAADRYLDLCVRDESPW